MSGSTSCPHVCGDGIIVSSEECDDGNIIDHDGCSSICEIEVLECGNLILEAGEDCDGGPMCNDDCTIREPLTCYGCLSDTCVTIRTFDESCDLFYDDFALCAAECGIPPGPEDDALCLVPDPLDGLPEGTRFWDAEGGTRHISVCEEPGSPACSVESCSRHIVCGEDGAETVNVIPCPEGSPCVDGACLGDPIWDPECFDSDGGNRPSTPGMVRESGLEHFDECTSLTDVREQYCIDDNIWERTTFDCTRLGAYCNGRACVPAAEDEVTCTETDEDGTGNGNNPLERGVTTVSTPIGGRSDRDHCNFEQDGFLEYYCEGDSMELRGYDCNESPGLCEAEECYCDESVESGAMCVPGELPSLTCHDEDEGLGDRDIFTRSRTFLTRGDGETGGYYGDFCRSEEVVAEGICDGSLQRFRDTPCPERYHCPEGVGACILDCSRTEATDTAGGYVTPYYHTPPYPDVCTDRYLLEMYTCNAVGEPIYMETRDCSLTDDEWCSNGRCCLAGPLCP